MSFSCHSLLRFHGLSCSASRATCRPICAIQSCISIVPSETYKSDLSVRRYIPLSEMKLNIVITSIFFFPLKKHAI
uniref:Putative ovule protein n=1 Tax=Solanum chacoense TaxID=4108 RepID=A0A0V0HBP6_SOLCH